MRNRETLVNWTLWSLIFLAAPRAPPAIISQEKLWVCQGGENENCLMAEVRVPIFHASYFFYDFKMREFWREFSIFPGIFINLELCTVDEKLTRSLVNQNPWWDKSGIQWHQRKLSWKNCKFLKISGDGSWHICIIGLACFELSSWVGSLRDAVFASKL